mmetsp:Transcript_70313/g.165512  ORF Transcript_70313/g.165512 Transcript_70313/m.165512 type:complete len:119 (+) Transcript_70313:43-399(+)
MINGSMSRLDKDVALWNRPTLNGRIAPRREAELQRSTPFAVLQPVHQPTPGSLILIRKTIALMAQERHGRFEGGDTEVAFHISRMDLPVTPPEHPFNTTPEKHLYHGSPRNILEVTRP